MSWLVKLYPKQWRDRYGAELSTLIEDTGGGWRSRANVAAGALRMHLTHWSAARLVLLGGILGTAVAALWTIAAPARFESEAVMQSSEGPDAALRIFQQTMSRKNLSAVIRKYNLYSSETVRMPMEDVIEKMRRDTTVRMSDPGSHLVSVRYANVDGKTAQAVANDLASVSQRESFKLIRAADLPTRAAGPDRIYIIGAGLGLGLVTGIVWSLVRRRPKRSIFWIAICGTAGCVVGFGVALALPERYLSTAVVRVAASDMEQVSEIANSRAGVSVSRVAANPDQLWLSVSFASRDRREAQRQVMEVTSVIAKRLRDPQIVDPPNLPYRPIFPNRLTATMTGFLAGLGVACIIIFARNSSPFHRTGTC